MILSPSSSRSAERCHGEAGARVTNSEMRKPLCQRVETTKRGYFIQKSVRCCRHERHGRHDPSQCPKQKHFPRY